MILVPENEVLLGRNTEAAKCVGNFGEIPDLDAGDVIEVILIVAIAANAIRNVADLTCNMPDMGCKALPLRRDRLAALAIVARAQPCDEKRLAGTTRGSSRFTTNVSSILIASTKGMLSTWPCARTCSGVMPN